MLRALDGDDAADAAGDQNDDDAHRSDDDA
jgi:hypothetical protein